MIENSWIIRKMSLQLPTRCSYQCATGVCNVTPVCIFQRNDDDDLQESCFSNKSTFSANKSCQRYSDRIMVIK